MDAKRAAVVEEWQTAVQKTQTRRYAVTAESAQPIHVQAGSRMTAAFLLDTSFLITLVDDSRRDHTVARQHYEHALQHGAQLHVSTLALAEFATKQAVTDLPLRTLRIEPFNIRHAIKSGELCAPLMPACDATDSRAVGRAVVRTDLQLIAPGSFGGYPVHSH